MFSKGLSCLFLVVVLYSAVVAGRNDDDTQISIPGMRGYVDAEELLEKALERILLPKGACFVNVDEKYPVGKFRVAICTPNDSNKNSMRMLKSALSDLGFTDVEVTEGMQNINKRYYRGQIDTFFVFLDPDMMVEKLQGLVEDTLKYSDLSIEDRND